MTLERPVHHPLWPSLPPSPAPLRRETTLEDVEEEERESFHPRSLKSENILQFFFRDHKGVAVKFCFRKNYFSRFKDDWLSGRCFSPFFFALVSLPFLFSVCVTHAHYYATSKIKKIKNKKTRGGGDFPLPARTFLVWVEGEEEGWSEFVLSIHACMRVHIWHSPAYSHFLRKRKQQ